MLDVSTGYTLQLLRSDENGIELLYLPVVGPQSDPDPGWLPPGSVGVPPEGAYTALLAVPPGVVVSVEAALPEKLVSEKLVSSGQESLTVLQGGDPAEPMMLRSQRVVRLTLPGGLGDRETRFFGGGFPVRLHWEKVTASDGPVSLAYDPDFESLYAAMLLNYESGRAWRVTNTAEMPTRDVPVAETSQRDVSTGGPLLEIAVDQDGLYRVTYADLAAAGFTPPFTSASLAMTNLGLPVAIWLEDGGDGSLDPGDYLLFYGQRFGRAPYLSSMPFSPQTNYPSQILAERYAAEMSQPGPANNWHWLCRGACSLATHFELYTTDNIYFLSLSGDSPTLMLTEDATPQPELPVPAYYTATVRAEPANQWWSYDWYTADMFFWERWTVARTSLPQTRNYVVVLSAPAAVPGYNAHIRIEVASRAASAGYPDHHTRFSLNGLLVDDAYWDDNTRYVVDEPVPQSALLVGNNTIAFSMLPDVAMGTADMYMDFIEIQYARKFEAISNQLVFRYPEETLRRGVSTYQVSGFDGGPVQVYAVDDPRQPVRLDGATLTAGTVAWSGPGGSYLVLSESAIRSPKRLTRWVPPDWQALGEPNYLLISHADFLAAAQPLADHRTSQDPEKQVSQAAVINVADLYRAFNFGIPHPIAIRNFLAYAFETWQQPPAYVVLVGNGHWNMRAGPFGGGTVFMPPVLALVDPIQGQVDSTHLLATVVGMDNLADLYIGRLPVRTPAELTAFVNKLVGYETGGDASIDEYSSNFLFLADDTDAAGDFAGKSDLIIRDFLSASDAFEPVRIYANDYNCTSLGSPACLTLTTDLVNQLNGPGALFLSYSGHGSVGHWANQRLFQISDIPRLNNLDQLPVILSMACLDGYWMHPTIRSFAVELALAANGGGIGVFAAHGLSVATGHDQLQRGISAAVLQQGQWTLGPALNAGKVRLVVQNNFLDLVHTFNLFGDPATRIPNPYRVPGIDVPSGRFYLAGDAGQTVVYTIPVTNTGLAADRFAVELAELGNWQTLPGAATPLLAPGETGSLTVAVSIPPNVVNGITDTVKVRLVSLGDRAKTSEAVLETRAETSGWYVTPLQERSALAGQQAFFSLEIYNSGVETGSLVLTYFDSPWAMQVSNLEIGPLAPGEGTLLNVLVTVPPDALDGQMAVSTLVFESGSNMQSMSTRSLTDHPSTYTTTLFTRALTEKLKVTLACDVLIAGACTETAQTAWVGTAASYPVTITNLTITPTSYTLSGLSDWPASYPAVVGPLQPGASARLTVTVQVPGTALGLSVGQTLLSITPQSPATGPMRQLTLRTTARSEGFTLAPKAASAEALVGVAPAVFDLQVGNRLAFPDRYDITYTFQALSAEGTPLDPAAWEVGEEYFAVAGGAAVFGPVSAGGSGVLPVRVNALPGIPLGETARLTVTLTSQLQPQISLTAYLTATAVYADLFELALDGGCTGGSESRGGSETYPYCSAFVGERVTFTLALTNTIEESNPITVPATFTVGLEPLEGTSWPTVFPALLGPLAPGESLTFTVGVTISLDALPYASFPFAVVVAPLGQPGNQRSLELVAALDTRRVFLPVVAR